MKVVGLVFVLFFIFKRYYLIFIVVQRNGLFYFCIVAVYAFLEGFCVGFQEMYNVYFVDFGEVFDEDGI